MIGTKIEWATDTVNFWWGCAKVSPACQFCYAESLDRRFHAGPGIMHEGVTAPHWGMDAPRLLKVESALRDLAKIRRRAIKTGERRRVFINSMSDFFEDRRDLDEARLVALDAMRQSPEVDFLLLTKRPQKIRELLGIVKDEAWKRPPQPELAVWLNEWLEGNAPRNIWLGTTVENQEWADKRVPALLKVPAAVRFLSCEPMLGAITFRWRSWSPTSQSAVGGRENWNGEWHLDALKALDWVICGGESGPKARPMHPDWARSLRDECAAAGVPFHFKQWGEYQPVDQPWKQKNHSELAHGEQWLNLAGGMGFHGDQVWRMRRVGKKVSGRLLDCVEHNGFPEVR